MNSNEILGHEKQISVLKNAIMNKNISHCYLFEGEKGLGKRDIALGFSKTLLCKGGNSEPCNVCSSCIKFDSQNHPDLKIISPEKGFIGKGEVENLIKSMAMAPFESQKKIFIIDDSDTMRVDSQNRILKTLEEPPSYVNIILISSNMSKLIPTILSRCQIIKFYPIDNSKIVELLEKDYELDTEKARFISYFTKGSLAKSIELATSEKFFQRREEIIMLIHNLLQGDQLKAFTSMDFFNENKEYIEEILDIIIYWFRDLLIYKEVGNVSFIANKDKIEILSQQTFIDFNKISDIIYRVEETKNNLKRNVNFGLSLETMLLSI